MAFGCCVISDRSRHLAATFAEGEEILFMEDCDPGGLSRYFRDDLDQAQAIATRARRKAVDEFAVAKLADELIAVMQTVVSRCRDRKSVVWGKGVSVRVDLG